MAANRCTRLFVCPNGNTYTLTGPCWYVNSMQDFWVCHGLVVGRNPFRNAPTGTTIERNGIALRKEDIPEDKTFLQKYWLPLMAAAVIAYFYFKKK